MGFGENASRITESSGLARGHEESSIWTHNDGANIGEESGDPHIYELDPERGNIIRKVRLPVVNDDWEDISSYREGGKTYLLLASTGDNNGIRDQYSIHQFVEPYPEAETITNVKTLKYSFSDGISRDIESIAYDPGTKKIVLITKRESPPSVYTLPMAFDGNKVLHPELVGKIDVFIKPKFIDRILHPFVGKYTNQPTSLDISKDGRIIVICTYKHIYVWERDVRDSLIKTLSTNATIKNIGVDQFEGVLVLGNKIYYTAEGSEDLYHTTIK